MAIFATQDGAVSPKQELIAFALLVDEFQPVWEIYIGQFITRFIPHSDHTLADGIGQLNVYCQIPDDEYMSDVHFNEPTPIEEQLGEDSCDESRKMIGEELAKSDLNFRIVTWPGLKMPDLEQQLCDWQEKGAKIQLQQ